MGGLEIVYLILQTHSVKNAIMLVLPALEINLIALHVPEIVWIHLIADALFTHNSTQRPLFAYRVGINARIAARLLSNAASAFQIGPF